MTLSIAKLEKLFNSSGCFPVKYYTIGGVCVYIELKSKSFPDNFMIYVPSKYEIEITIGKNVYKIQEIDINDQSQENQDIIENNYTELDILLSPRNNKTEDLSKKLQEPYNKNIVLDNFSPDYKDEIKELYNQLDRLKNCVKNINYNIGILYKNYIATIRHEEVEIYFIKSYKGEDKRKFLVIVDLELFYTKTDNIYNDIEKIRSGIYSVLNKNERRHEKMIRKMIDQQTNWDILMKNANDKKKYYESHIENFEKIFQDIIASEKYKINQLNEVDEKYNLKEGLQSDIEKAHVKNKLENELNEIILTKKEIMKNLVNLRYEFENIILSKDKILFDNIIMLNSLSKNIENLLKI
jgi:hypothetical protein